MMDKQDAKKLYDKLSKNHSVEDIAASYVLPDGLSPEEREKRQQEIWEHRKERLLNRTEEQKLLSGLLRIRYQMEDYVDSKPLNPDHSLANYLLDYMKVVDKKQKELAADIDIHSTRLSRILNQKEKLSLAIAYRLEEHCGGLIPALLWWKLVQKETELEIQVDTEKKAIEQKKVKNVVYKRA